MKMSKSGDITTTMESNKWTFREINDIKTADMMLQTEPNNAKFNHLPALQLKLYHHQTPECDLLR